MENTIDRREEFKDVLWQQGRLLDTKMTLRWNASTREMSHNDELHYAFVNFSVRDDGRSRICIFRFSSPEESEKAVQQHNLSLRKVK